MSLHVSLGSLPPLPMILRPLTIVPSQSKYVPLLKSLKVYSSLYKSFIVSQSIKQSPQVNQNDIQSVKGTPSLSNYHPESPSLFQALSDPPSVKSVPLFPRLYQSITVPPTISNLLKSLPVFLVFCWSKYLILFQSHSKFIPIC